MTPTELINYLSYTSHDLNLTIITTEEYERLRKIEAMAKEYFLNKRAENLKSILTNK